MRYDSRDYRNEPQIYRILENLWKEYEPKPILEIGVILMPNRVLAGGLGIMSSSDAPEPRFLKECFGDFLFENPPLLIWADEVIVPEAAYEDPKNLLLFPPEYEGPCMDFLWDLIEEYWDLLKKNKVIKCLNLKDISFGRVEQEIEKMCRHFIESLAKAIDEMKNNNIRLTPHGDKHVGVYIDDDYYCPNNIEATIIGLVLSRHIKANLLSSPYSMKLTNLLLYSAAYENSDTRPVETAIRAFCELFMPQLPVFPGLWNCHRVACKEQIECVRKLRKEWTPDTRKRMRKIMEIRNTDEICSVRRTIDYCASELQKSVDPTSLEDAKQILLDKNLKAKKVLNKIFPRIDRWVNLTFMFSLPLCVFGLAIEDIVVSSIGTALAAVAEGVKRGKELVRDKYCWVSFVDKYGGEASSLNPHNSSHL